MFFGGLTAQELLGEWDKYDYSLVDEKELGGVKVYEVEGTLKPGRIRSLREPARSFAPTPISLPKCTCSIQTARKCGLSR